MWLGEGVLAHDCEQLSEEWFAIKLGKLTASQASNLITPAGKPSSQIKATIARNLAEKQGFQDPAVIPMTPWMERGVEWEPEARAWFEVDRDLDTESIGFIEDESGYFGASPDALVIDWHPEGGNICVPLEIKVPMPSTHIEWLMDGELPKKHLAQVHFQMITMQVDWAYFMSYHPEMKPLIIKAERNSYTEALEDAIDVYIDGFKKAYQMITTNPF